MLKKLTFCSIFLLYLFSSVQDSCSSNAFKWEDYTRPITIRFENISNSNPLEIEVFLPGEILKANKKIPFRVYWDGDILDCDPYFTINNSMWARYNLPSIKKNVYIESKHFVAGRNIIKIQDLRSYGVYNIHNISFDLSKIIIPKQETLTSPPESTKSVKESTIVPTDIDFGRYYALVIGNNNYRSLPKLKTANNDAKVVAEILSNEYGFQVDLLLDSKRSDILLALGDFRRKLTKNDNLLVYYAGHGWLDKQEDEGYWLPIDAKSDNDLNWISNSSVTAKLKAIEAKHVLVVADSCYSGKLGRGVHIIKKSPSYFAKIAKKKARLVLSSGGLEPVIDSGGKENHSVFASAFIEALKKNYDIMDGTQLFSKMRRPVTLNSDQTPEYSDIRKAGHDGGDFIFVKTKNIK